MPNNEEGKLGPVPKMSFAEKQIVSRYTGMQDPELKRMTSDIVDFLKESALHMQWATESGTSFMPIGEYNIPLKVTAKGGSHFFRKPSVDLHKPKKNGLLDSYTINLNFDAKTQDIPHRFDGLLLDISKLAGLMPLDYNPKEERFIYTNPHKDYGLSHSWTSGKLSLATKEIAVGPDTTTLQMNMGEKSLSAFLAAVGKIKQALGEPHKGLDGNSPQLR